MRDAILLLEADPEVRFYMARTTPFEWSMGLKRYQRKIPLQYVHRLRGNVLLDVRRSLQAANDISGRRSSPQHNSYIEMRAKSLGFSQYEIWNKATIHTGHRLTNAEIIATRETCDLNEDHAMTIRLVMRCASGVLSLEKLRKATDLGPPVEPAIFSLLASGELRLVDPDQKLDGDALISLSEEHAGFMPYTTSRSTGPTRKTIWASRFLFQTHLKLVETV